MTPIPSGLIMRLSFDPHADPETREIFVDDLARTFYLAWRYGHIVCHEFVGEVWRIVAAIRRDNPKTADELAGLRFKYSLDITPTDWAAFAHEFFGFLTGEKTISFAAMVPVEKEPAT